MIRELALLYLVWGFNWVVMREANEYFSPTLFAALRFAMGAALLLAVATARRLPLPERKYWPWLALTGLLQIAYANVVVQATIGELGAGLSAVISYTMPLWVAVLAHFSLNERLSRDKLAGILLAIGGLCVLMNVRVTGSLWAMLLALSGAMVWALSSIIMKVKLVGCPMMLLTTWQMSAAALALALLTPCLETSHAQWAPTALACLLYNGVLASALAFFLWCRLLGRMPATKAASAIQAVPVVGVLGGVVCLGEPLTLSMATGMLLTLVGVFIVQRAA